MAGQKRGRVGAHPQKSHQPHKHHAQSAGGLSILGQAALNYARQGFAVLPCRPRDKKPFEGGPGLHSATTDKRTIKRWWQRYPDANIGLVMPKGMAAIDVDLYKGATREGLSPTLVQKSGGGGEHWLYKEVPEQLGNLREGVEVKANGGGYVVAAPSIHKSGKQYEWVDGFHPERIARFPSDLDPMFSTEGKHANGQDGNPLTPGQLRKILLESPTISADDRDQWIHVGMALQEDYGDELFDVWVKWSSNSSKFKGEGDCQKQWNSFGRGTGNRLHTPTIGKIYTDQTGLKVPRPDPQEQFDVYVPSVEEVNSALKFQTVSKIEVEKKQWVWPDRIAERAVSLLAGEGGVGKGHVTVEVVSTITNGGVWPDDRFDGVCESGEVLWFCAEDDPETELVPRLRAAGVNLEKVHLFRGKNVDNKHETTFSIEEDLALLDRYLRALKKRGIRLVVFDPITSYLHGKKGKVVDSHNATQLRSILQPLSEFSHRHDIAVLGLTHFAKDSARRMIHRVVGSQVWTAVARSVLFAIKLDPEASSEQAQNEMTTEYVLLSGKANNAVVGPAIRYRIENANFETQTKRYPKGTLIETSKLRWTEVDYHLREEDLIGKSEKGPMAVKQANLERAVRRFFDEQEEVWIVATTIIQYLMNEKFGSEHRVKKDLTGVSYLDKRNEKGTWLWAIKKGEE